MYSLPPPTLLHQLTYPQKVQVLDHLFEPCSTLAEILTDQVMNKGYANYTEFIEKARETLMGLLELVLVLDLEEKSEANDKCSESSKPSKSANLSNSKISHIVSAHPRLGPLRDLLSSHSLNEQKSLMGSDEETQKLKILNEKYESTFPGLRYVVFVNGRSRNVIMENMEARIARNDYAKEVREAFGAMCDIALDRARKSGAAL